MKRQDNSDATRALGCITKQQVNMSLVVVRAVPGVFGSVIFRVLFSVMWCGMTSFDIFGTWCTVNTYRKALFTPLVYLLRMLMKPCHKLSFVVWICTALNSFQKWFASPCEVDRVGVSFHLWLWGCVQSPGFVKAKFLLKLKFGSPGP